MVIATTPIALEVELPVAPTVTQELTVLGRLSDYVEATASAARTSERLLNVPQAVQVLPAQFIADIGALDTKDLYNCPETPSRRAPTHGGTRAPSR